MCRSERQGPDSNSDLIGLALRYLVLWESPELRVGIASRYFWWGSLEVAKSFGKWGSDRQRSTTDPAHTLTELRIVTRAERSRMLPYRERVNWLRTTTNKCPTSSAAVPRI
jgi:hypothetical protein